MPIKVTFIGEKKLLKDLRAAKDKFNPRLRQQLAKAAEVVVGKARQQFVGSRTRSFYRISGGKRVARRPPWPVTAPPKKLGIFSGHYRKQISKTVKGRGRRLYAEIGPVGIRYAAVHEFGTHGQKKRPVLGPALEQSRGEVERILVGVWTGIVDGPA